MTMDAFHPDHLKVGHMVGPWRIVESLGSGGFGRAFKAERDGDFFTLKMAVRPAPELPQETPEKALEERQVDGRMRHEGAILMANASHPGLPHLRAMDRWPHPTRGYLYLVTDFVPGEPFHDWRERIRPTAVQLVDIFIEVVRVVVRLHSRGILIRDFKSEHVIVNPTDNRPVLVDMGSAWLPGGSTLTVGLAPGTPHALPPECIAFIREGSWRQGARFDATAAGDLYQLGVFFYEALTEFWPFDARMTHDELLTAIQTVVPRAPHRLNPEVPESLSRITLRLLEKLPEARYESAQALLQALWAAAKERSKKEWKVPLGLHAESPAPITQEEVEERRLHQQESERRAQEAQRRKEQELSHEQALEQFSAAIQELEAEVAAAEEKAAHRKKWRRRIALGASPFLLGLALFAAWWLWLSPATTSPAAPEKGISLVSNLRNSRPMRVVAAWLCTTFGVSCTAAQVRLLPVDCPQQAVQSMEEMGLFGGDGYRVIIDINQPGTNQQEGVFQEGKIVSRVVRYGWTGPLPDGTLLYGQLWTEGLTKQGQEAVLGRYTQALLPDGRRVPICFVLGDVTGLTIKIDGSKPGQARLPREWSALAVRYWP
ncbi:serine/threonine protein kinase [Hyalangium rubrum]|uniref:non-specific serine/threonine protein kinase n=1 Tax=Hyalangium rubrum TaxID=3103134 RepID=A0ABU5HD36_9BACT|nr:serine/threonine-protein kinase [Hyalangium sp. s54d21]MDY7230020.1 serine/threonine-protein kinase [Hyalangium sp. s54d21]